MEVGLEEAEGVKRQGCNLQQLEREVVREGATDKLCIWGIEKYFDPKACYKHFTKNFGEQPNATHLLKLKNKPFFVVKFNAPVVAEEFNAQFAKNKRVKTKPLQEGMELPQGEFLTIEQCTRPAEKREVPASEEERAKVLATKIEDIVEPLHALPYNEQVQSKKRDLDRVIENYNKQYFRDAEVTRLLKEGSELPPLKLSQFVECTAQREGYRSKSEFTIGTNAQGQAVVGFNKGSYQNQTIMVETPRNVKIISRQTKLVVALLEHFIRTKFPSLLAYDRIKQAGFWRYLIVRESQRLGQSLVVVVCKTQGVEEKLLLEVKAELTEYMSKSVIGLVGLGLLPYQGEADSVPSLKPQLLFGQPYYHQRICDHTFRVSPTAFLQIHIDMCEVLYAQIINAVKDCDVVMDLGCGIGTIGISIRKRMPNLKVIGIEICEQAVEDAKHNDPDYQVLLGRAEDKIKEVCDRFRGQRIVAVLDPPRAGFNKDVMVALRRCRGLDNLIYVACNAGAIQDNLLQLTLPMTDKRRAPEFIIKDMKGFDLFPLTNHYEALYVMERRQ